MQNAFSTIARHSRFALVVAGILACPLSAAAQPAETPPPDVVGTYVDSAGCVWQRVDIGEQVAWAALLQADGAQLCGMVPTVPVESAEAAAEGEAEPEAEAATPEADPAPESTVAETPEVAETPDVAEAAPVVAKPKARRPDFPRPGYYLQVGAFRNPVNADRAVTFVQGLGLGALRQSSSTKTLQIIYAGPFTDRSEALAARRMVRKIGYVDAFIWEPK